MRSLRANLMIGIAAVTTVVFLCAAIAIYLLARGSLLREFDATTLVKARSVSNMIEIHDGKLNLEELDEAEILEFQRLQKPEYFQFWAEDGSTLKKSKSLGTGELGRLADPDLMTPVAEYVRLPDGRVGRQLMLKFVVHGEPNEVIQNPPRALLAVAREIHDLDRMLARLGWLLAAVSAIAVMATLILSALVIRRGLGPVNDLAARITRMEARSLSTRLPIKSAPTELSPIVLGLNGLLERLESAFEREKSFTADAAHELRTPLAGLESALEVCARKERAPEAYQEVVRECLDVVRGMHSMIDNLLLLARADAQQMHTASTPVDVDELLAESWRRFASAASKRGIQISWDIPPGLSVQTDPEKLRHVFSNVFENAVRYADDGGEIRASATRDNGSAHIEIANTGSQIASADADRVFERFWRGDPARSETGIHAGLGLAVCRNMMSVLRGSIAARSEIGGEFVVQIALPAGSVQPDFILAE